MIQPLTVCITEIANALAIEDDAELDRQERPGPIDPKICSLRRNHEPGNVMPMLVLRNSVAETALTIARNMEDFLFVVWCIVVISFLFPSIDDAVLREIQEARKELEFDLQQALDRYHEVTGIR